MLFAAKGYLWVDLFFALSGFILLHIYADTFTGGADKRALGFYLRARLARIYPLHLITLLAMIGLESLYALATGQNWLIPDSTPFASQERNGLGIVTNLLLVHAWGMHETATWNGPSWSISCEWAMYLFFPLLIPVIQRLTLFTCSVWLIGCWAGYGWLAHHHHNLDIAVGLSVCRAFFGFSAGMALCRMAQCHMRPRWSAGLFIASLGIPLFAGILPFFDALYIPLFWIMIWLACDVPGSGAMPKALSVKPVIRLGLCSYSLYLWHIPILLVVENASKLLLHRPIGVSLGVPESVAVLTLLTALTISVAWVSYRWIELPAQRWIRRQPLPAPHADVPLPAYESSAPGNTAGP